MEEKLKFQQLYFVDKTLSCWKGKKQKYLKEMIILLRKYLLTALVLTLVLSLGSVAFAAHNDTAQQNVNVQAPYILNRLAGDGTVYIQFDEQGYADGYEQIDNVLKLQVGAPGAFNVYAKASSGGQGVIDALYARASGHNWKDLNTGQTAVYAQGATGLYDFHMDYKVKAAELDPGNQDINETVVITYGFM